METFKIEAYSDTSGPSLWVDDWQCHSCGQILSPATVNYATHCPLHNPLRCTGRTSGKPHGEFPMTPRVGAEVFQLHIGTRDDEGELVSPTPRTVIGRIPS